MPFTLETLGLCPQGLFSSPSILTKIPPKKVWYHKWYHKPKNTYQYRANGMTKTACKKITINSHEFKIKDEKTN